MLALTDAIEFELMLMYVTLRTNKYVLSTY